jgi:CHRD domain
VTIIGDLLELGDICVLAPLPMFQFDEAGDHGGMMGVLKAMCVSVSVCACVSHADVIQIGNIGLDGFQPVPPTGSLATGTAIMTIDTDTRDIHVEGSFEGLGSNVLFGHLHGPADIGQISPIVIFALVIESDTLRSGTFHADARVNQFQFNAIMDSRTYLNIHSTDFQSGEIRGQVIIPAPGALGVLAGAGFIGLRRRR